MESYNGNCSGVGCDTDSYYNFTISTGNTSTNATDYGDNDIPFFILSDSSQIGLIFLYSLTTFLAITGNVIVVVVFTKGRRCKTDIRPFLINLAVADLIMAVFCLPFTFSAVMLKTWIYSKPMCPIVLCMQHLSVSASVFTNMAIGTDRFLVVMFPLRSRLATSRAKYVLLGIWICAIGLSSVQLVVGRARDFYVGSFHIVDCNEVWPNEKSRKIFTLFVLFITYIIPLFILSVTYTIVGVLLWRRTAPGNADQARDSIQLRAKRKVVKMLIIIILMFALCWLPLQTFFLVIDFNPDLLNYETRDQEKLFTAVYFCVHWLAMSNSFANPIIYGYTNESFRADLASICYLWFPFCKCLKKVALRKLSMSTCETKVQRQNAIRKNHCATMTKQSLRNGHKVYFELRRSISREEDTSRRASNVNKEIDEEREQLSLNEMSSDSC